MEQRKKMVIEQIQLRGVRDPLVVEAMKKVRRDRFVPQDIRPLSYEDGPLPIGHEQTISQPYIVAFMTEALRPRKDMKVLEIGTGSGYQAAVLGEIVREVYSIEIVPQLHEYAKKALSSTGYKNIKLKLGDGYQGWKEHAPFDAIILTAAPARLPQPLVDQLKTGGVIVYPEGETGENQKLFRLTKGSDGKVSKEFLLGVRFVPMTGKAQEKK